MAHNNIYEVSLFPVPVEDRFDDSTLLCTNSWFVGQVAEYTNDHNAIERDKAIYALMQSARGFTVRTDENGEYILVTSKEDFFRPMWENFKLEMESTVSLEKYMDYRKDDEKFGNYIYSDGELMSFADFIRECALNNPYYLGGIVGYHC